MLPLSTPNPPLPTSPNPCAVAAHDPAVDLTALDIPAVFARPAGSRPAKRILRDARTCKTAAEILAGFDRQSELYAFTKGRVSLLEILRACLAITGPAELYLSTWSAEPRDVARALELLDAGQITRARWLIDPSLQRRAPALTQKLRDLFGPEAIRMGANHAKFAVLKPTRSVSEADPGPTIVLRTSQNIEQLRANEQFTIAHDPPLAEFLTGFLDTLWRPRPALALGVASGELGVEREPPPPAESPLATLHAPLSTKNARSRAAASDAIRGLSHGELYGFTCGRFSFIDLLAAALLRVEPAALILSAWTMQTTDLATIAAWQRAGRITSARFLIDKSITDRASSNHIAAFLREHFGAAAVTMDANHGKWAVVQSGEWRVDSGEHTLAPIVIQTSMNLNYNPRLEDFTIAQDPDLAVFLTGIYTGIS